MKDFIKKIITKRTYLLVIIGILLLAFITLGRSYIQTTLSIIGNTKVAENSWIIYFDDVQIAEDSVETSQENRARIVDMAKTEIDFDINLQKPGDLYEFTVYTVNDGTYDVMIDSIEKYELSAAQKEYLEFEVKYDSGEELQRCDPLYHLGSELGPNRRKIKATVRYKRNDDINKYPTEGFDLHMYFRINYVQIANTCIPQEFKDYHVLTVRPNGGTYNGRTAETRIYLEEGKTQVVSNPKRDLYNFLGWNVIIPQEGGTYSFDGRTFTMGKEDVIIEADWEEGNYVARIMDTYYTSIQAAFNAVDGDWEDNTVWLLKNTSEKPTNNARNSFVFNLGGFTVTGKVNNPSTGNIALVNGRVEAPEDETEAVTNYGTFILGKHDGYVEVENSIALVGREYGLVNKSGSKFYFYDGYIEGVSGLIGGYTDKEEDHFVFVNHNSQKNCQKVYLVKNPNRAVAKTLTNGDVYYYNLQDAILSVEGNKETNNTLTDSDYVIHIIRDFEAAYELGVEEDSRIFIELDGFEVRVGKKLVNNGYLHMNNTEDGRSLFKPSMTIENNDTLVINNVKIEMTTDSVGIANKGSLDIKSTFVQGKANYAVSNTDEGTIVFDTDTVIQSYDNYGLFNNSSNLVIDNGLIYGFINEDTSGDVEITGNAKFRVKSYLNSNGHYAVVLNRGVMKQTGGEIYSDQNAAGLCNIGTYNITGGKIDSTVISVSQSAEYRSGTINVEGGEVTGANIIIDYGTVNVRNGAVISGENGPAVVNGTLNLYDGIVEIDDGITIHEGYINIYGGELRGSNQVADYIGAFYIEGGKVIGSDKGISCTNAVIAGGEVTVEDTAITTHNINMTGGKVISNSNIGIIVKTEGAITGGEVYGELYGVQSNNNIRLGEDDNTISQTTPVLVGGSYGLYINGNITDFYDGILKGQADGYNAETGRITGTPLGSLIGEGQEDIDGNTYETDFIELYENWIRIGSNEYNSINLASMDCPENDTCEMEVFKNANLTFKQMFIDENNNKQITFDLNGFTVKSTQTITNNSNVTIIDSSDGLTGTFEPTRVPIITNKNTLTLNGGNYVVGTASNGVIQNNGTMIVNTAYFDVGTTGIINASNLRINDIEIHSTRYGITNSGDLNMYGGEITASDTGILGDDGVATIYDGEITGAKGISGNSIVIVVNGGKVHSLSGIALESYWENITVNGGEVIADHDVAVQSHRTTYVTGGHIVGTNGVEHGAICGNGVCVYSPVDISGNPTIEGKVNAGVLAHGSTLTITGGNIYGEIDGVQNFGSTGRIGEDEGSISISNPLLQGKRYGLNTTSYIAFYDGILKGPEAAHLGLISIIPDATMIKDDYEFINRVEYKTQYLTEFGDWLQVGDQTYNSLTSACEAIDSEGTIKVIASVYVNFAQALAENKKITLDLNGHEIIMTQPIHTKGEDTIIDSIGTGYIHNIRDNVLVNEGTLTVERITIESDTSYGIRNIEDADLTIDDINLKTYGGIENYGDLEINGGYIEGTSTNSIKNYGDVVINGGEIVNEVATTITGSNGNITVNGGKIEGTYGNAITFESIRGSFSSLEINGGEIIGKNKGIDISGSDVSMRITGGDIKSTNGVGVYTTISGSYILGGNIEGAQYGLFTSGTTTLGDDDGSVAIDLPMIKGDSYGVYIESGTLNFYDGILKGVIEANSDVITNIPDKARIFEDTEEIDEKTYNTKYLIAETDLAKNLQTGKVYTNLQESLNEAKENETVQLIANAPLYYAVTNNNENSFTLDLNGFYITTNKPITNNGKITIVNSSDDESTIKSSSSMVLLTNNNILNIDNVTLKNNSSDRYVINNTNKLTLNDVSIDARSGVKNSNEATITNTTINAVGTAIENTGDLEVTGGSYKGNYSLYSSTYTKSQVKNATMDGAIYNNNGLVDIDTCTILKGYGQEIINNSTMKFKDCTMNIDGAFNNNGNLEITGTIITHNGNQYRSNNVSAITNNNVLKITNSEIHMDEDDYPTDITKGITNNATLTLDESTKIYVGKSDVQRGTHYGVVTSGSGNTIIDNATIQVRGGSQSYGVYISDTNSRVTLLSGTVDVQNAVVGYGSYINLGKFTMGHYEGLEVESELTSTTDPVVFGGGTTRGIGVKKVNGEFEFYDGIIWGTRYSKPETTTLVEKLYEVTTYLQPETGYEYSILEYMPNDYTGRPAAMLNGAIHQTLQDAIDVYHLAPEGSEIKLLKPLTEDIHIESGKKAVINLEKYTLTGKVNNEGTLQVFNGSIISFDDDDDEPVDPENPEEQQPKEIVPTINNSGTLIIGQNDESISSTNIRIVSENKGIVNTGDIYMYDGFIEGNPAVIGEINHIADYSRLHTIKENMYERIYLQSLDKEAIMRHETDLILTIDPDGGKYNHQEGVQVFYLKYEEEMEILMDTLEKVGCEFDGWDISDPSVFNNNIVKMDIHDVTMKARWRVTEQAKAKIGNIYYLSLTTAVEAAKDGETVELLANVEEDITVRSNIKLDLGGFEVTGEFINMGELTIDNGTIRNPNGVGLRNLKTLTMGYLLDARVYTDTIKVIGTELGIQQDGRFNFYDGYIQGTIAMNGVASRTPLGYSLYTEHVDSANAQKLFLSGNPELAVASITEGESTQFFFKLTDAIASAMVNGQEIKIERDFDAGYPIVIPEEANIVINMSSRNISSGNEITNNGEVLFYDEGVDTLDGKAFGSITSELSVTNNGKMTIQGITFHQKKSVNTIVNNTDSELIIKDIIVDEVSYPTIIESTDKLSIMNYGDLKLLGNYQLKSTDGYYALEQRGTMNEITTGSIHGIHTYTETKINGDVLIDYIIDVKGGTLDVKGATITTPRDKNSCIYTNVDNTEINVDSVTMSCKWGIYTENSSNNTVVVKDSNIDAGEIGYNIKSHYSTYTSTDTNVTGARYAVENYGKSNTLNIYGNGTFTGNNERGIYSHYSDSNNRFNLNIYGGLIQGSRYGIVVSYTNTYIENAEIKTNSTNRDNYAMYTDSYCYTELEDGTFINGPKASGFRADTRLIINDGVVIYGGGSNAFGLYVQYTIMDMYGGIITATGGSGYGIYTYHDYDDITIHNGLITSENVGIYLDSWSRVHDVKIYGGKVYGRTYGVLINRAEENLTIGNSEDTLSTEVPLIHGGTYGVYKTAGKMNFYSGRIQGYTNGYNDETQYFSKVRTNYDISSISINNEPGAYTVSTEDVSSSPLAENAKMGDGYAKITYISESNSTCMNNQTFEFPYTGTEREFSVPCTGTYTLETWGAQGGSTTLARGGYGGYSKGDIELTQGEKLYINVGGQGTSGKNTKPVGGYNGGGSVVGDNPYNRTVSSGGGATSIATKSGLLSTLVYNKNSVIMVAAGGGGAYQHDTTGYDRAGGDAGGYIGGTGVGNHAGTGGTQYNAGCSANSDSCGYFGLGGNTGTGTHGSAGGGGYYGGGGSASYSGQSNSGGGGGSSYIGNSRLTNSVMYGYNAVSGVLHANILTTKDDFLQVGTTTYSSFQDAFAAIPENGTGTVVLLKDVLSQEDHTFPNNKNITFDLNGHKLQIASKIYVTTELHVIDSSNTGKGEIESLLSDTFESHSDLYIDGVKLKCNSSSCNNVYATSGNSKLDIKNSTLTSVSHSINVLEAVTRDITIENTTINSQNNGINFATNSNNNKLTIKSADINTTGSGIRIDHSYYNTVKIYTANITSTDRAIFISTSNNTVTIDDGTYISTNSHCIDFAEFNSSRNIFTMTGGTVTGYGYGMSLNSTNSEVSNVTINTTGENCAVYSIGQASTTFDGVTVNANRNGIYMREPMTIKNSSITTNGATHYGIHVSRGNLVMENSAITTTGSASYGLISNDNETLSITLDNNTIDSKNVGLSIGNGTKTVNINSGTIEGDRNAVHLNSANSIINIGKESNELSIVDPKIKSDSISVAKGKGKIYFYNGLLTSNSIVMTSDFDGLRADMDVKYDYDFKDGEQVTLTVSTFSSEAISEQPKEGNGYAKITYIENDNNNENVPTYDEVESITNESVIDKYLDPVRDNTTVFEYTGSVQKYTASQSGKYLIELWGAQGNDANRGRAYGGLGAYTSGYIQLNKDDELYVHVGERRHDRSASYNAGSTGGDGNDTNNGGSYNGYGGGGATDVRLANGSWNDTTSLRTRIMVAAGGGGGSDYAYPVDGGNAGGLTGYSGINGKYPNLGTANTPPTGGTQTSGGTSSQNSGIDRGSVGTFGVGGNGNRSWGSGGGGGYYGGAGGGYTSNSVDSGAGGSSYISGHTGSIAVVSSSSNTPRNDSNNEQCTDGTLDQICSIHYSGKEFTNTQMIDGSGYIWTNTAGNYVGQIQPDGTITSGHEGNGYAKIAYVGNDDTVYVKLHTNLGELEREQLAFTKGDVLNLPVLSVSGVTFNGWFLDKNYTKKVTSSTTIYTDTHLYASFTLTNTYCDSLIDKTYTYDYIGGEQVFDVICSGKYKLELWGAQGGNASYNSISYVGGYGGYSTGEINLSENEKLYINVGGQGQSINYLQSSGSTYFDQNYGYNGGGYASYEVNNSSHAGGGGATHIATSSGLLKKLSDNRNSVIIVAGGGGGASAHYDSPSYSGIGGGGGGHTGGIGQHNNTCYNYGTGGSQEAGGSYAACTSDGRNDRSGNQPISPGFGYGSNYNVSTSSVTYAGGGGGYYGGGSGWHAPGAGGSGYVGNSRLYNTLMVGYNVDGHGYTKLDAYLVDKVGFLEVDGVVYNSFSKAINAITSTGTIKVLSNVSNKQEIIFPENKTITLDLNGMTIESTYSIVNNGTLTITDNSGSVGTIINETGNVLDNKGTLIIDKVNLSTTQTAIVGSLADGSITLNKNANIEANNGVSLTAKQTLEVNGAKIKTKNNGIVTSIAACDITINDIDIDASNRAISISGNNSKLLIKDGTIVSGDIGIYTNGSKNNITIDGGTIRANSNYALYTDGSFSSANYQVVNINGGTLMSSLNTIRNYRTNMTIKNATISTLSTSKDNYAIYMDEANSLRLENVTVDAPSASGIRANSTLNIDGATINAGNNAAYGINSLSTTMNINNCDITTPGEYGIGIYSGGNYAFVTTLDNTNIDSGNIGIQLSSGANNRTLNIYSGSIKGNSYGVYQTQNYTTTIGDINRAVSTENPSIEGVLYGYYKTAGTSNMYSGVLKGTSSAYYGTFNNIKNDYELYEFSDSIPDNLMKYRSYSTLVASDMAIAQAAKKGNGYARLTYVDDSVGTANEEIVYDIRRGTKVEESYEFDYSGHQEEFVAPITADYQIQAWGAQGGDSQDEYIGGYGGYATGIVHLNKGEKLYINVGGRGEGNCVNKLCEGGYNGGGYAGYVEPSVINGAGGGATSVAKQSGLLSSLSDKKSSIIIVAGGGGGGTFHNNSSPFGYKHAGGSGGGIEGNGSCGVNDKADNISGSGCGGNQESTGDVSSEYGTLGSFGQGASLTCDGSGWRGDYTLRKCYAPGAGGGYYGGSTGNHGTAGGGSGFINSPQLSDAHMTCYDCKESSDSGTLTYSTTTMNTGVSTDPEPDYAKIGHGYLKINVINSTIESHYEYSYSGTQEEFVVPKSGIYTLKVWGAQGGSETGVVENNGYSANVQGGPGGYSTGSVYLSKDEVIYVYVGGQGGDVTSKGPGGVAGYNGGGQGGDAVSNAFVGSGGGGGATHIALKNGLLSTLSDDRDKILIVAGGGGGASWYGTPGSGGGISGGSVTYNSVTLDGATQNTGYRFGQGQNGRAGYSGSGDCEGTAGGGGGYYGGLSYQDKPGSSGDRAGSGGSGYIGNSLLKNKHMTCYECTTSLDPDTLTQSTSVVSETAKDDNAKNGNGYAMIIFESEVTEYTITLSTNNGTIAQPSLHYQPDEELGDIPAPVVNDNNLIFDGWYLDQEFTKKVVSTSKVNDNATLYAKFSYNSAYCTARIGSIYDFDYTGGEQTHTIECSGSYKLEVWGAQGGTLTYNDREMTGGYGGYSVAYIDLFNGEKLYVNVGGQGNTCSKNQSCTGGYNGGGDAYAWSDNDSTAAGGGGATHIAFASGVLSSLEDNKKSVIIVAGGGAGSAHTNEGYNWGYGGHGGGYIGGTGTCPARDCTQNGYGTGGSQTEGGYLYRNNAIEDTLRGSFGQGYSSDSAYHSSGGGGGWYGGGGSNHNVSGGGSGYAGHSRLYDQAMYSYDSDEYYTRNSVVYLIPITDKITNKTTGISYKSIQTALNEAENNDVLELIGNSAISEALTVPNKTITIDLHGYKLNSNKAITNNGVLTITDLTNSGNSVLDNRISALFITNTNSLTISNIGIYSNNCINSTTAATVLNLTNVSIDANGYGITTYGTNTFNNLSIDTTTTGIANYGEMTANGLFIEGGNYAIYNITSKESTVKNAELNSATAMHLLSSGKLTFTENLETTGVINNSSANTTLVISPSSTSKIHGEIKNNGTMTISGVEISNSINNNGNYVFITNTGELTLQNNKVTLTNTNNRANSNYDEIVSNSGTLRSTSNEYTLINTNVTNRRLFGLDNYAIMYSTNDKVDVSGGKVGYGLYTNSNNTAQIRNVTVNVSGDTTVYGLYSVKGTYDMIGGVVNATGVSGSAIYMEDGTISLDNTTFNITGTGDVNGAYIAKGSLTMPTGTINATGNNVYGVRLISSDSILTLGVEDGNVSTTSPLITATGTTSGIGVSKGNGGKYNYYDGKVMGTTSYKDSADGSPLVENWYEVHGYTYTDPNTNIEYSYCILELLI